MEDSITFFYPNGRNVMGRVIISAEEIVVLKKSTFISAMFGLLGSLLDSGKVVLTLKIEDIVSGRKEKFRLNKNAYHITMKNGDSYVLCFSKPNKMIPFLESAMQNNR